MDLYKYTNAILFMCHYTILFKPVLASDCNRTKEANVNVTKLENRRLFLDNFNKSSESLYSTHYDCLDLNFISEASNGHVCILHLKPIQIQHDDLAMHLKIGSMSHWKLALSSAQWNAGEQCSTNNTLTISFVKMKKRDFVYNPNMLNNLILYIYDIQNLNREIYMFGSFCDEEYPLYNGRIMIYDKYPGPSDPKNESFMTQEDCPIKLINNLKENPFCLLYTILSRGNPDTKWMVYVITIPVDLNSARKDAVYNFSSDRASYALWCDDTVRDSIILLLSTPQRKFSDSAPQLFQIELSTAKKQLTTTATLISSTNRSEIIKSTPSIQASTQGLQLITGASPKPSGFLGDGLAKIIFYTFMACLVFAVTVSVYYYFTRIRVQKMNEAEEAGKSVTVGSSHVTKAKSATS